ncbi:MAG: DUF3795 domain-containing protein [Desulfomonilia bacterium]|uniref:DUF3795 domain-containing protein n=1 Tax=anaerobic digester metagenome TaxID=1263854 RepID=A0A485M8E9_9ZZZZ|nr:DUF3795 domain-containing protein [Pseudomonadota bacterium]HON39000.1 DUF3795 domain-containing protein [Deltaproteobacteria bacterium]HRS56950.1 DUF3795 domain-containing protein [Desulfomonilia bacterium]HPD22085.1 DUF3795 domain-containing protein [Deltaproteobacteria bacterium]HPX18923.1 DUF3795 domain-containing protein [Deltaproteobacteria bacterium]
MIACCGLDCSLCEAYTATKEGDEARRAQIAKEWSVLYNTDIQPEHICCDGCRAGGRLSFYSDTMCEIRKCCMENDLENCAECTDYPCDMLRSFLKTTPEAEKTLERLRAELE